MFTRKSKVPATYTYQQNQFVTFEIQLGNGRTLAGNGTIIGCVDSGSTVIGKTYMISPIMFSGDVVLPTVDYPFKCIALSELYIKPEALVQK